MKRPEGVAGRPQANPAKAAPAKQGPQAKKARPTRAARPAKPEPHAKTTPQAKTEPQAKTMRPPRTTPAAQDETTAATPRALARVTRIRKRYERDEVKRFTRRARRRRTGWFLGILVVLALVGLVALAVFSPLLALRTITVDGTSRLSAATLEKAVDNQRGTPLAMLNYSKITHDLSPFHLIRSYATEIVPPDTLIIHVVERTPVGVVQGASGFDLVDPAGVTVESSKTRPAGYPLIQLGKGTLIGPGFASMAQVLLALPAGVLTKVDTITAQTHDDVTLTLTGSNQRVVWGSSDDSDAKAQVLADLIALHAASGAGEYDVSAPGTAVFHHD